MQTYTDEKLDEMVLYFLSKHVGKNNRIERWTLVERVFGVHVPEFERNDANRMDRDIRHSVRRLRNKGHLICDMGEGGGRWLAETKEEFWEFYAYFIKPIASKAQTARAMKKSADLQFNILQMPMFGSPQPIMEDFADVLEAA